VFSEARRLEIDCERSDVDHRLETDDRFHASFYLERRVGALFEIHPLNLGGQRSRACTKSGRPYSLASRPAEKMLYANGVETDINDLFHTYEIMKADSFTYRIVKGDSVTYETIKDDSVNKLLLGASQPEVYSAMVIPHPLHRLTSWDTIRSDYRIQQCPSTATTVCIALSRRPGSAGYDTLHPEHHEIVLDRRTLLPKSWRQIYGDRDGLTTYSHFDLNPTPRALKVPPGYFKGDTSPLFPSRVEFNLDVQPRDPASPQAKAAEQEDNELAAEVFLVKTSYCVLRVCHLF
jgi:hypothetical protein